MEKFPQETNLEESPNPLKAEHLKEGVRPIIAAIGTPDDFAAGLFYPYRAINSDNVNYYGSGKYFNNKGYKNAGPETYVISTIDTSNKHSERFANCTGLVVSGIDKETGENISLLSHQDPDYFLSQFRPENKDKLVEDLTERICELKARSVDRTIDALIVGGNYLEDEDFKEKYINSIKLLAKICKEILGFEPAVITGPKTGSGRDHIFYDNKNRRLYIIRPEVGNESTKSYLPSMIEEQEKKWTGEE